MTNTNLRPEAGGDPARSHSDDLKNDPVVTREGNDFPDAPPSTTAESPQDKPDMSKFAAKLGTDTIESGDGLDSVPDRDATSDTASDPADTSEPTSDPSQSSDPVSDPRPIFAGAAAVAGLIGLAAWRRQRRSRVARIVDTLDVFDVVS